MPREEVPRRGLTSVTTIVRPDFDAYSVGLCYVSVCTSLTDEEATDRLNHEHPTGINSSWFVSTEPHFHEGYASNPCPCPSSPSTNRHVLFQC